MKAYTKTSGKTSRTLESNPSASRQAPISEILQTYRKSPLGTPPVSANNRSARTIQRMTLIAEENKDEVNDFVILVNMKYARDHDTGTQGIRDMHNHLPNPVPPQGAKEPIHLVQHGAPGEIGAYNGNQIATFLTTNGLTGSMWGDIEVYSCDAGIAPVGGNSLVQDIRAALAAQGFTGHVRGRQGLALTHAAVGKRTVNPAHQDNYLDIEEQIGTNHGLWNQTEGRWKEADVILEEKLHAASEELHAISEHVAGLSLEQKAELMEILTTGFYQELITASDNAHFLYDEGEGVQEI